MMVKTLVAGLLAAALACGVSQGALAAAAPSVAPAVDGFGVYPPLKGEAYLRYQRQSLYVPVRDGVRLAVDVFRPMTPKAVEDRPLPVSSTTPDTGGPGSCRTARSRPIWGSCPTARPLARWCRATAQVGCCSGTPDASRSSS